MQDYFAMLARYNRVANERLFEACAKLSENEYRKSRAVSFGNCHALLNHMLLGDRIWMRRFTSEAPTSTPPPGTQLCHDFPSLRLARTQEDAKIETFFGNLPPEFLMRRIVYTNSLGVQCSDLVPTVLAHFFNHQTHHRGQVHSLLAQAGVQPPSLDLHRIVAPAR